MKLVKEIIAHDHLVSRLESQFDGPSLLCKELGSHLPISLRVAKVAEGSV